MKRRGFLQALFGGVAAAIAAPLAVFAPAPDVLVPVAMTDAPAAFLVTPLGLSAMACRQAAKEALGRWMVNEIDRLCFNALAGDM